jgi:hypothetical protein
MFGGILNDVSRLLGFAKLAGVVWQITSPCDHWGGYFCWGSQTFVE